MSTMAAPMTSSALTQRAGPISGKACPPGWSRGGQPGRHHAEEDDAEGVHQLRRQPAGIKARHHRLTHRLQRRPGVPLHDGRHELAHETVVILDKAGRRHLVESREGIASRAVAPPDGSLDALGRELELRLASDIGQQAGEDRESRRWNS